MTFKNHEHLTKEEKEILINKATEAPFSGEYTDNKEEGLYTCKLCSIALFKSSDKFSSNCGWPSFDDEIKDRVKKLPDSDGIRTEILCNNCNGHLGHIFKGENFTKKNQRYCVNSLSMNFIAQENIAKAFFALGCFWGAEQLFKEKKGVISTQVGYSGGKSPNPTYKEVCSGSTGHAETVEITYNKSKIQYDDLVKFFFEIHDPGQLDRQGPDIGTQYRSVIFYQNTDEKERAEKLKEELKSKGYKVLTEIVNFEKFYPAEDYHQDYYNKKGGKAYCHFYQKKF